MNRWDIFEAIVAGLAVGSLVAALILLTLTW